MMAVGFDLVPNLKSGIAHNVLTHDWMPFQQTTTKYKWISNP